MTVLEMAKQYYPRLWPESRILALEQAEKLTQEEADEILGRGPDDERSETNG